MEDWKTGDYAKVIEGSYIDIKNAPISIREGKVDRVHISDAGDVFVTISDGERKGTFKSQQLEKVG